MRPELSQRANGRDYKIVMPAKKFPHNSSDNLWDLGEEITELSKYPLFAAALIIPIASNFSQLAGSSWAAGSFIVKDVSIRCCVYFMAAILAHNITSEIFKFARNRHDDNLQAKDLGLIYALALTKSELTQNCQNLLPSLAASSEDRPTITKAYPIINYLTNKVTSPATTITESLIENIPDATLSDLSTPQFVNIINNLYSSLLQGEENFFKIKNTLRENYSSIDLKHELGKIEDARILQAIFLGCCVASIKNPDDWFGEENVKEKAKRIFGEDGSEKRLNQIKLLEEAVQIHLLAIDKNMENENNKIGRLAVVAAYNIIEHPDFDLSAKIEEARKDRAEETTKEQEADKETTGIRLRSATERLLETEPLAANL